MKTWVWTYDAAGNILTKSTYAYTTGALGTPLDTVNYTYGDSQWGDLLTAYDGQAITYDEIGNPLSDGTWTYTWEHGRQLASMSDGSTTWSYEYDANGLRTKRTNGTKTYEYYYTGDQLTVLKRSGQSSIWFYYDASGTPYALYYEGAYYYYMTNAQGDVVAIVDNNGNPKVYYQYDAWGNEVYCTGSMSSTLGNDNPLRYRGYVYDEETELYYLQSRYYNPQLGRFLNADALVSTGQGILGNNMFAYCNNNPIRYADYNGRLLVEITVTTAGTVALLTVCGIALWINGTLLLASFLEWIYDQWYYANIEFSVNQEPQQEEKESQEDAIPEVTFPGDNPNEAPEGTVWKGSGAQGSGKGNYYNPQTGESWHPDLNHPDPIGPHWDYRDPLGIWWRVLPDGTIIIK